MVWPGYEREFELLEFAPGRQDEKWFQPPKGFRVVDGEGGGRLRPAAPARPSHGRLRRPRAGAKLPPP
jgi:hypothetical protein